MELANLRIYYYMPHFFDQVLFSCVDGADEGIWDLGLAFVLREGEGRNSTQCSKVGKGLNCEKFAYLLNGAFSDVHWALVYPFAILDRFWHDRNCTSCTCSLFFSVTPCEGKPCRNSGECLENVNGSFTCKCQVNYDGLICEKRGTII